MINLNELLKLHNIKYFHTEIKIPYANCHELKILYLKVKILNASRPKLLIVSLHSWQNCSYNTKFQNMFGSSWHSTQILFVSG